MPATAHVCPHCRRSLALIVSRTGELMCLKCGAAVVVANGAFNLSRRPLSASARAAQPSSVELV